MMGLKALLFLVSFSFGLLSAAGVFTVFVAVGLIPRFAGKTKTQGKVQLYENMVIFGTIFGTVCSVFAREIGPMWGHGLARIVGNLFYGVYGVFSGIFIGCLAFAIAEMLDSIPIFMRRIRLGSGLKYCILSMAIGKLAGSLLYFVWQVGNMVKPW